jgi:tripartite-type tricarboxylate transporter receptor subunit TctC
VDSCGPVLVAVLGGHVDVGACGPGEAMPHLTAKTMRLIGVMNDSRMSQLPDVLTFKEQGWDLALGSWIGFGAPKGTPPEILTKLRGVFEQVYNDPEVAKAFNDRGFFRDFIVGDAFKTFAQEQTKFFSDLAAQVKSQ